MKLHPVKFAAVALILFGVAAFPPFAAADQPLGTMRVKSAALAVEEDGSATLHMTGTAEGLGNCSCYGELVFAPGEDPDEVDGVGVVVFTAANGDRLVGVIAMEVDEATDTFSAEMHWRDSVTLRDGTTIASSGRFAHNRPPGLLVVIAIIAILIG